MSDATQAWSPEKVAKVKAKLDAVRPLASAVAFTDTISLLRKKWSADAPELTGFPLACKVQMSLHYPEYVTPNHDATIIRLFFFETDIFDVKRDIEYAIEFIALDGKKMIQDGVPRYALVVEGQQNWTDIYEDETP